MGKRFHSPETLRKLGTYPPPSAALFNRQALHYSGAVHTPQAKPVQTEKNQLAQGFPEDTLVFRLVHDHRRESGLRLNAYAFWTNRGQVSAAGFHSP